LNRNPTVVAIVMAQSSNRLYTAMIFSNRLAARPSKKEGLAQRVKRRGEF